MPFLDESVAQLSQRDRTAILLRFYERQSFSAIGRPLGLTEESARKRVARAVEKLRQRFARRGVPAPSAAITASLTTHAVRSAPQTLASAALHAVSAGASPPAALLARQSLAQLHRKLLARILLIPTAAAIVILPAVFIYFAATHQVPAQQPAHIARNAPPPSTAPVGAATPINMPMADLIAHIKSSESQFQNLYIRDFETTVDVLPRGANAWQPTPMGSSGSAWYDATPAGKTRIYFAKTVMRWEPFSGQKPGAPDQYVAQSIDMSWDGKEGHEIELGGTSIKNDKPDLTRLVVSNTAMLRTQMPTFLDSPYTRYDTGIAYTLQYRITDEDLSWPRRPRVTLSDYIAKALHFKQPPELAKQTINGFDTIRLQWTGPGNLSTVAYWLSPAHNYAIVKYQYTLRPPIATRDEGFDVFEFKQIAPGVFFPLRAQAIRDMPGPTPQYYRYTYKAADAVANDPKFDPAIFTAKFPQGYFVSSDAEQHASFVVREDATLQEVPLHTALPRVKRLPATRPDADKSTALPTQIEPFPTRPRNPATLPTTHPEL